MLALADALLAVSLLAGVSLAVVHIRARHIAVASFPRSRDAERAYTRLGEEPWRHEVAFIERHGGGRARIVRRRLSAREAKALRASVADAPPAKALNETEVW